MLSHLSPKFSHRNCAWTPPLAALSDLSHAGDLMHACACVRAIYRNAGAHMYLKDPEMGEIGETRIQCGSETKRTEKDGREIGERTMRGLAC